MPKRIDVYQKDGLDSVSKGREVIARLLGKLQGEQRSQYQEALDGIPGNFTTSTEQTAILNQYRTLRDRIKQTHGIDEF